MFREINSMYVVSSAVVLATLVFAYIAVRLRVCGYDVARDVTVTESFYTEEVDVLSGLKWW